MVYSYTFEFNCIARNIQLWSLSDIGSGLETGDLARQASRSLNYFWRRREGQLIAEGDDRVDHADGDTARDELEQYFHGRALSG